MDVLTSETCWALNNEIIKQVTSSWSLFIENIRCLGCTKAICTIQEEWTANGINKELDGLKGKCLSEKMKLSHFNLYYMLLFIY